jgi:hypothetical protein
LWRRSIGQRHKLRLCRLFVDSDRFYTAFAIGSTVANMPLFSDRFAAFHAFARAVAEAQDFQDRPARLPKAEEVATALSMNMATSVTSAILVDFIC